MVRVPDGFGWPAGWKPLPLPEDWLGLVGSVESELAREVCRDHLLHDVDCRVVGFNSNDTNEFLLATDMPAIPLVFVHLTWQQEEDPSWPFTEVYAGWEAFRSAWDENAEAPDSAKQDRIETWWLLDLLRGVRRWMKQVVR